MENNRKITDGVLFYDHNIKLWTIILHDNFGNQYGDAEYYHYKRDAMTEVKKYKSMGVTNWTIQKR